MASETPEIPPEAAADDVEMEEATEPDEVDSALISMENIDRESPELWPEKIPGMNEFMSTYSATNNKLPYCKEFDSEDTNLMNHLSVLPVANLIAKVKELHDLAYQLGKEESKEMTKGKCLNIFDNSRKNVE